MYRKKGRERKGKVEEKEGEGRRNQRTEHAEEQKA